MFTLISGFINWYFATPTFKLLLIGDEHSGKSTYLEQLKHIYTGRGLPLEYITPTCGQNRKNYMMFNFVFSKIVQKLKFNNTELLFWDLSGKETFRRMWESYLDDIEGLVYMIDVGRENIEDSIKVLKRKEVLNAEIPVLILINKIDLISLDDSKLKKVLNSIDYSKLHKKHFLVKEVCALKGVGLEESIRWLYNTMIDYSRDMEAYETKGELSYYNIV